MILFGCCLLPGVASSFGKKCPLLACSLVALLPAKGSGTTNNHILQINADGYTPVYAILIPTGKIESFAGTAFDFTQPMKIGSRLDFTAVILCNQKIRLSRVAKMISVRLSARQRSTSQMRPINHLLPASS